MVTIMKLKLHHYKEVFTKRKVLLYPLTQAEATMCFAFQPVVTLTASIVSEVKRGWYTNDGPSSSTNFPFKPLRPDGGDDRSKLCFVNECASHTKDSPKIENEL